MPTRFLLAAMTVAVACSAEAGKLPTAYSLIQRVQIEGADYLDNLGFSLAASDDTLVAGAINVDGFAPSAGAAYVFNRDDRGKLDLHATLRAPASDQVDSLAFGASVVIRGDRLIATTLGGDREASPLPPTYVFDRNPDSSWEVSARLFPQLLGNETSPNDVDLGRVVSLGDDLIAIQASHRIRKERTILLGDRASTYWDIVRVNAIHLFEKQSVNSWQQIQLIEAEDFPDYATIGIGATFSGEQLILQATRKDNGNRDLLVLERRESGLEIAEVIQPLPGEVYRGYRFVFQGDHALVTLNSAEGFGVVGVYEKSEDNGWERVATLTSGIDSKFDEFGAELALDGDLAFITGFNAVGIFDENDGTIDHEAYVLAFGRSETGSWSQIDRLTEPPLADYSNPGRFGWSLAAVDGVVYVGTGVNTAGTIYVFAPAPEPSSAMQLTCLLGLAGSFSRPTRRR